MRLKCPRCRGCMTSKHNNGRLVFYCDFCQMDFNLRPKNRLERVGNVKTKQGEKTRQKDSKKKVRNEDVREKLHSSDPERNQEETNGEAHHNQKKQESSNKGED